MSFIGKAVKKVFKVAKKVVKSKWFKYALIAAAVVFTAGVAAGGFAAFAGVSTVGGFMGAVGTTMATGWTAIAGGVASMFGAGGGAAAAGSAATVGTTANTVGVLAAGEGALGGTAGLLAGGATAATEGALAAAGLGATSAASAAAAGAFISPLASNVVASGASKTIMAKIGSLLLDPGVGGTALRSGLMMGAQAYFDNEDKKLAEKYYRSRTVYGNAAFGSDGGAIEMPTVKDPREEMFGDVPAIAQQKQEAAAPKTREDLFGANSNQAEAPADPNAQPDPAAAQMAYQQTPLAPEQAPVQPKPNALFTPENLGVAT